MSVTIRDVAAKAGVSVSTVSKVMNGWSTISEETCNRVNSAIRELHFVPNARAVNFARKNTKNIIFLTSLAKDEAYTNPHMFDILSGVFHSLNERSYTMTIMDVSQDIYPGESMERLIAQGNTDGIIVHGSALNEEVSKELVVKNFPHTIIGDPGFDSALSWIDTNHTLGGQFAAEHLLSKGYKNIAFVGDKKSDSISNQRLKGLRQGMAKEKMKLLSENVYYTDSESDSVYEAVCDIAKKKEKPDAVVCENSKIGFFTSKKIKELGFHIPKDIALLTFDRYPYSTIIEPKPTVIDIDMYDMGVQAGITISRKIENPSLLVQSYTTLPLLIEGETT